LPGTIKVSASTNTEGNIVITMSDPERRVVVTKSDLLRALSIL
jgi:hypothetical protein